MSTPCVVITRDRASYTKLCLSSLGRFSDRLDIHIVDHGSTWPEMLSLLEKSEYPVHRRGDELPRSLWEWPGLAGIVRDQAYIVTDPDIVIDSLCPDDWLDCLHYELVRDASYPVKVGLGIRIDDLPETELTTKVRQWEEQFWKNPVGSLNPPAWRAPVDTTLALYQPLSGQRAFSLGPAVRLGEPYLIAHLPWYGELDPSETSHYREHALPGSSHWINGGW